MAFIDRELDGTHDALVVVKGGRDDVVVEVGELVGADVGVHHGFHLFTDEREELLLVHDSASEDDDLRAQGHDEGGAGFCDVVCFDVPHLRIILEGDGFLSPALFDGRPGGHALEAGAMVRAVAFIRIVRVLHHRDVPELRVKHAVYEMTTGEDAGTDAGTDRDVDGIRETARLSVSDLAEERSVDIGIEADRNTERALQYADDVNICPAILRGRRDIAVGRRVPAKIDRTETGHTERCDLLIAEPVDDRGQRFLRRGRRDGCLLENRSVFIAERTYHLRAAGL